jgi:hypothetical protein
VPLLENLRLDELTGGRHYVSLLIVAPIKVRGATASVVARSARARSRPIRRVRE